MPCLLVLMAFFAPRLALAILLVFTHVLESVFSGWVWPLLGFFFAPVSTLCYAIAIHAHGSVSGFYFILCVFGAMVDLGVLGGGVRTRQRTVRNYL